MENIHITNEVRFHYEHRRAKAETRNGTRDLRAGERQSASRAQRHFSPASLFPPVPSCLQRGGDQGRERRRCGTPVEQKKWRPPKWRPPARPLRGGAGSGKAAATTTRPRGALPGSARADTKEVPGGSKPGAAGGAGQP